MDVIPVLMGPNNTRRLVEALRGPDAQWRITSKGDEDHPAFVMARSHWQGSIPLLMERADGADLDVDRARHEAADAIEMLLDRSLRPTHQGIGARLFLTTVRHMLHEMRRTADVHARGPWLPPRVHARDGGPPPFGPATLAAWNLACAPGLRVSSRMRNSPGTFVGSPRSLHFSADEFLEGDMVGVMRTMPALMELVRD